MSIYPLPKSLHFLKKYHRLIEHGKTIDFDGYTENHHIIPLSMGGSNNKSNLVTLSARYHFLAHYMLFMAYRNRSMANAFRLMTLVGRYKTSEQFQIARSSRLCIGELNGMFGKNHTTESRKKISENRPSKKGISYDEIYGIEISSKLKAERSILLKSVRAKNPLDGIKNPRYDPTEYTFLNLETNETIKCTKLAMNANYGIPRPALTVLTKKSGKYKTWVCSLA